MLVSIVFPEKELTNKLHSLKSRGGIILNALGCRSSSALRELRIVTYRHLLWPNNYYYGYRVVSLRFSFDCISFTYNSPNECTDHPLNPSQQLPKVQAPPINQCRVTPQVDPRPTLTQPPFLGPINRHESSCSRPWCRVHNALPPHPKFHICFEIFCMRA